MSHENNQPKPLLYKVEIEDSRNDREKLDESAVFEQNVEKSHQEDPYKEEKLEQVKREFGVYEVMAEIAKEKLVAESWISEYRKPADTHSNEAVTHVGEPTPKKKRKRSVHEILSKLVTIKEEKRPLCEANLFGKKQEFLVVAMRGQSVRVRVGNRYRVVQIADLKQFKVLQR